MFGEQMRLLCALALVSCMIGCTSVASVPESIVTIDRDEWGVPHIYADTEEGGYYGLGYAMSEDRFERLMGVVLFARGESASAAESSRLNLGMSRLDLDIQTRRWRTREMAEQGLAQMSPQLRRSYAAFAAGIRAYVAKANPKPELAAIARSITIVDLVAIPRAMAYYAEHEHYAEVECGLNGMTYSRGMLPYKSTEKGPASNGWVVMPRRTAAGALILASPLRSTQETDAP
jgi:acyl-homoserine-lactone acylase